MELATFALGIAVLLFALSFHEAAHAWTANRLGDPTAKMLGRVTMNPIAHIDPVMTLLFPAVMYMATGFLFGAAKPVPVDTRLLKHPSRDHAVIAAAGPISNLILVVPSVILLRWVLSGAFPFSLLPESLLAIDGPLTTLLWMSVLVNLILATFNLLPIPPLDGSWIVSSYLSGSALAFYRSLRPYGFMILLVLLWSGWLGRVLQPVLQFGQMLAFG
jgi:Zn-dependent protease